MKEKSYFTVCTVMAKKVSLHNLFYWGGGRNVEFHYYDRPFFSLHQKCLFISSLLQNHYIENVFLVHHYIKNHCLFSSSLLKISEHQKEWKEHWKSQFCLIFTLNYLWQGFPTFYLPRTTKRAKKMFAYHQFFLGEMKLMKQTQEKSVLGHLTLLI